jgi:hypothetical protein
MRDVVTSPGASPPSTTSLLPRRSATVRETPTGSCATARACTRVTAGTFGADDDADPLGGIDVLPGPAAAGPVELHAASGASSSATVPARAATANAAVNE